MTKLILFDIDGTLLTKATGHGLAFSHAFKEVFGIETTIAIIPHSGMTDQQIIIEVLKKHHLTEDVIIKKMPECMHSMIDFYEKIKEKNKPVILEGVLDVLKEFEKEKFILGLVTGNLEPIARAKLTSIGINQYFKLGGFGNDDISRSRLVELAIKRAEENFTFTFDKNVFLFGDTPNDIKAGIDTGVNVVGIATGIFSIEDLRKAGAKYVVNSFVDKNKILDIIFEKSS
ncbi:MAG: HAD hydrolase-like protein [Nanoarchaeota archaeon]